MQKKNLLFAAGLMLFAACSEDIQPGTSDNGGLNFTGEGEMLVELKFNNASGTRVDNGSGGYKDGEGDESKVKDATFYFFNNEEAGSAYLGSSGKITVAGATADKNETDYIESNIAVTVPGLVVDALHDSKGEVKVIVVLNRDNGFTEPVSGQTYESFRTQVNKGSENLSFMMTNSVYYTGNNNDEPWKDTDFAQNIENSIGTVTKANVYEKGTTEKKQVFTVYVERVCSKVTFAVSGANNSFDIKDAEDATEVQGTVTVKAWGLNILNTKYYPVKQLAAMFGYGVDDNNYSSWPASQAKWNNADNFRSFWAVDPNYSGDGSYLADFTKTPFSDLKELATTGTNALYCLENTFSNKGQDQDETTSVVVLAQFLLKNTQSGNVVAYGSKGDIPVYYSEDDFLKKALTDKLENTYYKDGEQTTPLTADDFELRAGNPDATVSGPTGVATGSEIGYESALKIALQKDVIVYDADGNQQEETALIEKLTQGLSEYTVYVNGYCYYSIPIRHFADSEVSLTNSTDINKNSQLGRYGIVRNHVYNVNINSIKALGKPVTDNTPEVPDKPDDKFEFLMDASINVLSWAVRNQNVDL